MPTPTEPKKDTIYIDVDDEITAIIEKLQKSEQKIVALVLPKWASVLQSVLNMKLLKRTAEKLKKNVVLITSEAGLLPLAGAVGMHVASSLQSKPAIPLSPNAINTQPDDAVIDDTLDDADEADDFDPDAAATKPVGVLANKYTEPETIQLDNEDVPATAAGLGAAASGGSKKGKNKSLKIPNFNKFRMVLIVGILAVIVLIAGLVWANTALPKATISLKTNSTDVSTKATLSIDPTATEYDPATNTIPAKIASKPQTGSQQVSTSGQKNNGTKASGTVSVSQVCTKKPAPIDSGTGFSTGGLTFISTAVLQLNPSGVDADGNFVCKGDVNVISQQAGTKYNVAAGSKFTIAGFSTASGLNGSAFDNGTDNIIKVVAQADIDSAKAKISSADNSSIKSDLEKSLTADGYTALLNSLNGGEPAVTTSANVGDQSDTVTVTQVTTYTMYGIKQADVKKVITASVNKQIDTTKQQILNDGVNQAKYQITSPASSGAIQTTVTATSLAGPDINVAALTKQFAGKKTGDIAAITKTIPGVSDVTVKYSPFWVHSVPKKTSKITVVIVKADGAATSTQPSSND